MDFGKKEVKGVIFDLDGVIVSTDECHYEAWKCLAEQENIFFDREINKRLRGVSRLESLEIVLERAAKIYNEEEKRELAERKNEHYKDLIKKLTPKDILPGVKELLQQLKAAEISIAIGSSSKNAPLILERIGLSDCFHAVVDGNHIKKSKPDPEVFLKASERLKIPAENCVVVEDADAGIEAALAAGMRVIGVGGGAGNAGANLALPDLTNISVKQILEI